MEQIIYRKTLDVHKNGVQFTLQGFETADNMSRVIEISLMASGDSVDFPLENLLALMYITSPGSAEPSISECIIKDNKVVYNVLPIAQEGITYIQLKLIRTSVEGAESVLVAPKFAIEVTKSDTDDESAQQTESFTALENAVAKAKNTYDQRLLRVEVDNTCIFRAYYADGTVYETDALKECLLHGNALLAKSYAVGETGTREEEDTDNSKYYCGVSKSASEEAKAVGEHASDLLNEVRKHGIYTSFTMDFDTGHLIYSSPSYAFSINQEDGELEAEGLSYTPDENPTDTGAKASAGRILIRPRGSYDPNTTYEMLDLVNYNGIAYLAKKTVSGIEPTDAHNEYWHNLLEIDKIAKGAVADTVAGDVIDGLEERFRSIMSQAMYVSDLNANFDTPTFVQWNAETENTPYKSGLTSYTEGFALVHGIYAESHSLICWTKGSELCFTRTGSGSWNNTISSAGGVMTGALALGSGKGTVSADDKSTFLEAAKDTDTYRRIEVENPSITDAPLISAAKLVTTENGTKGEYKLLGEHNTDLLTSFGFGKIEVKSYKGYGVGGGNYPCEITFKFAPRVVICLGKSTISYDNESYNNKYEPLAGKYNVILCDNLPTEAEGNYKDGTGIIDGSDDTHCGRFAQKSNDGKTIRWYSVTEIDSGYTQCNYGSYRYWFVGIA